MSSWNTAERCRDAYRCHGWLYQGRRHADGTPFDGTPGDRGDELGCEEDFEAVEKVLYSGSCILGTVHAENMDELEKKSVLRRWKKDMVFERLVRLGKKEDRERYFEIFDGSGNRLC